MAWGALASRRGMERVLPALDGGVLTTGRPGKPLSPISILQDPGIWEGICECAMASTKGGSEADSPLVCAR